MSENMQQCSSCGELVPLEYVICVWCGFDLTAEHIRRSGIKIGRKEAFGRMKKVIVNPIQAFKEIALIPDLNGGRWIFYLIGVTMTLNMLAIFSKLNGLAFNEEDLEPVFTLGIINISVPFLIGITFLLIQPLVLLLIFNTVWKIGARIIGAFSRSFGGTADRLKVRAAIGYSMVPVLLAWTVAWLIRLVTPATNVAPNDEPITYESVEQALVTVSSEGIGVLARYLIMLGWIWATVLGIIGISKATRISYVEGLIVAGIPYIIFMTIVT